jgi:PmbA protein
MGGLIDFLRHIVDVAENNGAYQAEAYFYRTDRQKMSFERCQLQGAEKRINEGIGIRVAIKKGKGMSVGFAYSNCLKKQLLVQAINYALRIARARAPDPLFQFCKHSSSISMPEGICDEKMLKVKFEEITEVVESSIGEASKNNKLDALNGQICLTKTDVALCNSVGVRGEYTTTKFTVEADAVVKKGISIGVGWDYYTGCVYDEEKVFEVLGNASTLAVKQLHPQTFSPGKMDLIVQPEAVSSLFAYTLIQWLRADNVQKMCSPLFGKVGQRIASSSLNIIDDGQIPQAVGSKPFDDEGCPKYMTNLIEGGVLKGFLHNTRSAKLDGVENTGNAVRSMPFAWKPKYALEPLIGPTNFRILPSTKSYQTDFEDLIAEVRCGIITKGVIGAHTVDALSGDFSIATDCAFKIERGQIVFPLRHAIIAGNVLDMINNIKLFANNEKQIANEAGESTAVISPALLVGKVTVLRGPIPRIKE